MVDAINTSAAGFGLTSSINSEVSQNRNNDDFERGNGNRRRGRDFDRIEISGDARIASNSTSNRSESNGRSNSSGRADFFSNFRNFASQALNRVADDSNGRVASGERFGQARDRLVEIRERIIARFQDRFGGTPSVDDPTTNEPSGADTQLDDSQGVVDAPTDNETPTDSFPGDPNSNADTTEDPIPGDPNAADDTAPLGNAPQNDTVLGLPNQGDDTTVDDAFPGDPDSNPQTTDAGIGTGSTNDGTSAETGIGLGGGSTNDTTTTTGSGIGTGGSTSGDDSTTVTLPPADQGSIGTTAPQPEPEPTPVQIQAEAPQTFVAPTSSLGSQSSASSFIRIIDI